MCLLRLRSSLVIGELLAKKPGKCSKESSKIPPEPFDSEFRYLHYLCIERNAFCWLRGDGTHVTTESH